MKKSKKPFEIIEFSRKEVDLLVKIIDEYKIEHSQEGKENDLVESIQTTLFMHTVPTQVESCKKSTTDWTKREIVMSDFQLALTRPKNFFTLSGEEQWEIDKRLGILDWDGECNHYPKKIKECQECQKIWNEYWK